MSLATYSGPAQVKTLAELIHDIGCSDPLAAYALFDGFLSGLESHLHTLQMAQQHLQEAAKKARSLSREAEAVTQVCSDILDRIRAQRASIRLEIPEATH